MEKKKAVQSYVDWVMKDKEKEIIELAIRMWIENGAPASV